MQSLTGVTLFASAGIGDLALRALGVDMLVANELIPERAALFAANYPETLPLVGDIWELADEIVDQTRARLAGRELDVLIATPPCQGMSSNGLGKLLAEIRAGNRPALDPRNRLILPTIDIIRRLRPRLVVFENVPAMRNTAILDESGAAINILALLERELQPDYAGTAQVVEFADYGVPQRRQRLITVYTRDPELKARIGTEGGLLTPPTHAPHDTLEAMRWRSVGEAIGHFPPLDAIPGRSARVDFHPLHRVPVLDPKKYEWIRHTPEGRGAFDNQCVDPACGFDGNPLHGASKSDEGINRPNAQTPLYCVRCGSLLPRPYTERDGEKKIMRGFTSAYKRMLWNLPAPTLTTNLSYPSSDHNLHPSQNRVLSLHEALTLHTISEYDYVWTLPDGEPAGDTLIRESIGESVPPAGLERVLADAVAGLRTQNPVRESLVA